MADIRLVSPGHMRAWWLPLTAITIKANKIEADMLKLFKYLKYLFCLISLFSLLRYCTTQNNEEFK